MSRRYDASKANLVAIIGMAGRFPGARNLEEFWENLKDGVESIRFFSDEELLASGVDPALSKNPRWVPANGYLKGAREFDASFFGYSPREAAEMDPQHRLFLECSWEAFEDAGYIAEAFDGSVGVYAGCGMNEYLMANLMPNHSLMRSMSDMQLKIGSGNDFLTTRVSYKLNLTGPSLDVSTACSTSMVAVQLAWLSLASYQCDMALAGGVFLKVPQKKGYLFEEGSIYSPDGRCRAFDAMAAGTPLGEGVGAVVLKRLEDALADGDNIRAVIRGAATNNDGAKIGFTAPSAKGQAEVIAMAQAVAGVDADSIDYIETHGTGTPLGDAIEIAGLTKAFRSSTERKGFCAIGSMKPNVGLLVAAAGVAGLIKTVLALEHELLPATLHFKRPSPEMDLERSPFFVNDRLREWRRGGKPRIAGVSAFGIGGTNSHAIVEEAPLIERKSAARDTTPWHLLVMSARTPLALETMTLNLAEHFERHPDIHLADAAHTLRVGRKTFHQRRIAVCRSVEDASRVLRGEHPERLLTLEQHLADRAVAFSFPGEGTECIQMARDLHLVHPVFRQRVDSCLEILEPHLGRELRHLICPSGETSKDDAQVFSQPAVAWPALFVVEYALAELWSEWGIRPGAMLGFGPGEYVAACLAGVFPLAGALELVATRGRLTADRAGDAALEPLAELVSRIGPKTPQVPLVSGRTGDWITESQATAPAYWAAGQSPNGPFTDAVQKILNKGDSILLQVGPGDRAGVIPSMPNQGQGDSAGAFLEALGRLWLAGATVDWEGFQRERPSARRVSLPTYPFERKCYWIDPPAREGGTPLSDDEVGVPQEVHNVATRGVEETLAAIWSELLGVEDVGLQDDFFDLGGHSLLASRVATRIRDVFGVEVSLSDFFSSPTIAGLAKCIGPLGELRSAARSSVDTIPRVSRDEALALSSSQRRLWFLSQLEPHSPAYNVLMAVRISGPLNVEALQQALDAIVNRHESLRTTFKAQGGDPFLVIDREGTAVIRTLRPEGEEARPDAPGCFTEEAAQERVSQETPRPFNLERGPLLRALLLPLGGEQHLFVLVMHHIISDGWSITVLMRELGSLYESFSQESPASLPELPCQYADYAQWRNRYLETQDLEGQADYWKEKLAGALPLLQLPTHRRRPAEPSYKGGFHSFELSGNLTGALEEMSRREGVTLFMTLLAAFQTLLHRYSGQEDIVVGVPIANRNPVETEGLVGFFLNMLPMRSELSGDGMFRDLLARVRDTVLQGLQNQDLPFERLVEIVQPVRDLNYHPIFQTMFAFQNFPIEPMELSDVTMRPVFIDRGVSQFDLSLYMWKEDNRLVGALEYSTELFDRETMGRCARHFQTLLESVAAEPGHRIGAIRLLTAQERERLTTANAVRTDYPRDAVLPDLFQSQVARTPEAVAAVFEGQELTYVDLNRRSSQLAARLRGLGIGPGSLAGVYVERSLEMLVGVLGVMKAGGAYVPLDPAFPADRLAFMIDDAGVSVLLTQHRLAEQAQAELLPAGTSVEMLLLDDETTYSEQHVLELGRHGGSASAQPASAEDLAYVIYTSGSTGKPKGVQIPHRALVNCLLSMAERPGFTGRDVLLAVTTLSFDISALELFLPLLVGGRVAIVSRETAYDGNELMKALRANRATVMQATPTTWRLLLEAGWCKAKGLKALCGGEALPRELADRILATEAELWNVYGPTETTIWSAVDRVLPGEGVPKLGLPVANTELHVLDSVLEPTPDGVPGELFIGGDGLARGYLNRPELTAEKFIPHPFSDEPNARLYKTGDMVRRASDGSLEFLGRLDHQVKVRGFRIELGEIEARVEQHPSVGQCVAVVREDSPGDARLVAYVTRGAGSGPLPDANELREHLRKQVPEYMVPASFVWLEWFPMTPNGKVDRKGLPRPDLDRSDSKRDYVAPRDQLEIQLVNLWAKVLGRKSLSIRDNYFDLGGNSLQAARLFAQMEKAFGRSLPLALLFRAPTIEQIAEVIRQKDWKPMWSSLVPIQTGGTKPPLFLIHGAEGNVLLYRDLATALGPDHPVYGLQSEGLDGCTEVQAHIETMAARYLREIRTVQADGPYYLGGYCMGGTIAYEIAQQLHAEGQETALLALFETYNLCVNGNTPVHYRLYHPLQNLQHHFENLLSLRSRDRFAFLREKLRVEQGRLSLNASIMVSQLARKAGMQKALNYPHVRIDKINDRAQLEYEPKVYPGRITVFRPKKNFAGHTDAEFGWRGMAEGGLEVQVLPISPRAMMVQPFVRTLAERLGPYFR